MIWRLKYFRGPAFFVGVQIAVRAGSTLVRAFTGNLETKTLLQQFGACLIMVFHSFQTIQHFRYNFYSIIFKPYSILDPTWECPQNQKLTKIDKVKLFLEPIPRVSPFSEPFLV